MTVADGPHHHLSPLFIAIASFACSGPHPEVTAPRDASVRPTRAAAAPDPGKVAAALTDGAFVLEEQRPLVEHGETWLRGFLQEGNGRTFRDLIAVDVHRGIATVWDGHATTHGEMRYSIGDGVELAFDPDVTSYYVYGVTLRDGEVVIGDGDDPRVHRYPDFAAARAAVDNEVFAQDPARVMAALGGKVGGTATIPGLLATHLARPRTVDGHRVTVQGVVTEAWNSGLRLRAPNAETPTVICSMDDAQDHVRVGQSLTATGVVREDITLHYDWHGAPYRGDARGVFLDECHAR